mgnify:CR=1 FL=1
MSIHTIAATKHTHTHIMKHLQSGSESLPTVAPLQRSYGIIALCQKYQNVKKSDMAMLSHATFYKYRVAS